MEVEIIAGPAKGNIVRVSVLHGRRMIEQGLARLVERRAEPVPQPVAEFAVEDKPVRRRRGKKGKK